jgi:hypothetical protein
MGRLTASIVVIVLSITTPATAEDATGFTVKQLYQMCSSTENSALNTACVAYLRGLIYGIPFGQESQKDGKQLCLPKAHNPEVARLIVKKFIEDNPKILDADGGGVGDFVSIMALANAFPCSQASPAK